MSDTLENILGRQRDYFNSGITLPASFRIAGLGRLRAEVNKRRAQIEAALETDLKRNRLESFLAETLMLSDSLKNAVKKTARWAAPKRVRPSILNFPSWEKFIPEPYGVSLIISPWNYPFLLSLGPLVAAVSAGNCALIKPSRNSPASSALVAEIVDAAFPPEHVAVVQTDANTTQALLEYKFDKIFFTGSTRVGKLVLEAAAQHITPATLELGGKSPCIVTESANLSVACKRIVWGKFLNAGQTCVAPDYILVHYTKKDDLIAGLTKNIIAFYGHDIRNSPDYPRIINAKNHARLVSYLEPDKPMWGGEHAVEDLYFGPTIMPNATWEDPAMQEEIFGPILPIIAYDSLNEAVAQINSREKPLALYLFTNDKSQVQTVWSRCHFGGGCVNDILSHLVNDRLPFGGVGSSGMGNYHGRWGFEAFSHYKSQVKRAVFLDPPLRYPPHSGKDWLKKILIRLYQ